VQSVKALFSEDLEQVAVIVSPPSGMKPVVFETARVRSPPAIIDFFWHEGAS